LTAQAVFFGVNFFSQVFWFKGILQLKKVNADALAVCCASRFKSKKIADQAIFYPANCQSSPFIEGFLTGTRRV
jgi:hypothetical protein